MLPNRPGALAGMEVLLVDVNAEHRTITRLQLESYGARVRTAATTEEAVAAAAESEPDVVLTELNFGRRERAHGWLVPSRREGVALVKRLSGRMPVVVLTTLVLPADRAAALAAGSREFLAKPCGLPLLLRVLQRTAARTPRIPALAVVG